MTSVRPSRVGGRAFTSRVISYSPRNRNSPGPAGGIVSGWTGRSSSRESESTVDVPGTRGTGTLTKRITTSASAFTMGLCGPPFNNVALQASRAYHSDAGPGGLVRRCQRESGSLCRNCARTTGHHRVPLEQTAVAPSATLAALNTYSPIVTPGLELWPAFNFHGSWSIGTLPG